MKSPWDGVSEGVAAGVSADTPMFLSWFDDSHEEAQRV
jgi:hypothetical protein